MKKFLITLLVLFLVIIGIGISVWFTFKHVNHSNGGTAHIFEGATSKQIADILESEKIIDDADYFYVYIKTQVWYHKYIKKDFKEEMFVFKEGDYNFPKGDFRSILQLLAKGENDPQTVSVTLPEGLNVKEIANILDQKKIIKKEKFLAYVRDEKTYLQFKEKYPWLPAPKKGITEYFEGYLHTTTYLLDKYEPYQTDANILVNTMLEPTDKWYKLYSAEIEKQNLSFSELLTLASVIEKEAKLSGDRPKIAQVFYNRMKKRIPLQSDMTAAYANGKHKVFLYYKDIQTKSPYNTYYVKGLPIGPIASPSEASLLAAIHPAGETFTQLFFYARPNGETFYANTVKEHQHNINKYEKEWKALEKQQK